MGTTVAGLEGVVAGESEICFIAGYAGFLGSPGPNIHAPAANPGLPPAVVDFLKTVPQASPMDVLRTAVSMLGIYDPETPDMTPDANDRKALRLMAQTATIVTTFDRLRKGL